MKCLKRINKLLKNIPAPVKENEILPMFIKAKKDAFNRSILTDINIKTKGQWATHNLIKQMKKEEVDDKVKLEKFKIRRMTLRNFLGKSPKPQK